MKIARFIEIFRERMPPIDWATEDTKAGNSVRRASHHSGRYIVDFSEDFTTEGWLQFDTDQDAGYFGVWVNPKRFLTLTYAEGDWTLVECPDAEHYNASVQRMIAFYGEGFIAKAIHQNGMVEEFRQNRSQFLAQV